MATASGVNMEFVRSVPGILRISEFVVSLCAIISIESGYWCPYPGLFGFYETVSISATVLVFLFIIFFLFSFDQKLGQYININATLLLNDAVFTLFYFIASIITFVLVGNCYYTYGHGGRIAAAIFGLLATGLFGFSAFVDYKTIKGGPVETGVVVQPKPGV